MPENKINRGVRHFVTVMNLLLFSTLLAAAASHQRSNSVEEYSESLLVVPSANSPQHLTYPDGRQQLTYTIDSDYPATGILSFLSSELRKRGWKPLRFDFLNPDMPSSHVRGWTFFEDATQEPRMAVRQWMADWENRAHDITLYNLEYRSPSGAALESKPCGSLPFTFQQRW
jgi:hypothetical protein